MHTFDLDKTSASGANDTYRHRALRRAIKQAARLLPSQGPITVFVHHNTLHAFEHLQFDDGVQAGGRMFGCHAYLPEQLYRDKLVSGRIRVEDLDAVLQEDLGDEADRLVATFGTKYALRLAMLQFPLHTGSTHELRWVVAETEALRTFRAEVEQDVRDEMMTDTRQQVLKRIDNESASSSDSVADTLSEAINQFNRQHPEAWSEPTWEAFVLTYLWRVCCEGIKPVAAQSPDVSPLPGVPKRHRDIWFSKTGEDSDVLVHDVLIRFTAVYLDQGVADWSMPGESCGLFESFLRLYAKKLISPTRWTSCLRRECSRLLDAGIDPLESIEESLDLLGVCEAEQESYITSSLLALRGWAGMVWQMETNAEWAPRPAPEGSLIEFLAVRLVLDRLAVEEIAFDSNGYSEPIANIRDTLGSDDTTASANHFDRRAFTVFQLAQVRGWKPHDLQNLSTEQWVTLVNEIEAFGSLERRRIYHRAFERKYRNEMLDAVIAHASRQPASQSSLPLFQVACCIDDREESFRRHLEEVQPNCETLGIAGFFGVAMYYRGAADAHFTPLCPVNVKPKHYVVETPVYSAVEAERMRAGARRRLGHATHKTHLVTRSFLGGALTGLFGSLAAFPLVARILFPRTTAQLRKLFGAIVRTNSTELRLERLEDEPGSDKGNIGYNADEMAGIVEGGLRALGLAKNGSMSRLVVICGHGSASLNNPHKAAYDCGACGGGRGGPNARAFAQMANDPRVRRALGKRGLTIPETTLFVGGYHNTCDDSMTWYDLDRVPIGHRELFEQAKSDVDEARRRSAHERCRRFESAGKSLSFEEALRHVEGRSEDLSQTRPECGHATNALCLVGRRDWNRGLFLDRRAFLTSYDPTQDDEHSTILEGMLRAVIPVCAGINLEYYFSYVDSQGYGCGTKLPHNITSLLGVMDGAASDLRSGLPWQMVEIHEPMRLLFVIETTREAMIRIINENSTIAQLVNGEWVQLAVFDPETKHVHRYVRGNFLLYAPHEREIPTVASSVQWYGGHRDHLGFASVVASAGEAEA